MKIDTELRHIIVATARANAKLPNDSSKNLQQSVDTFLATAKGRKVAKEVMSLETQIEALDAQSSKLRKKQHDILSPVGLDLSSRRNRETGKNEKYLKLGYGDDEKMAFVKSGGSLPAPERRNWSADELLRQLAASKDEKTFNTTLKEYGINWT